jgi:PKD repeat protein
MRIFNAAIAAALLAASACTVQQADPGPAPFGPSDFALAIGLTALPDTISHDGASQSSIVVTAHDANGQPRPGVVVRLDMGVGGTVVDFGRLSARTVVTGTDGRATAIYTAPAASPFEGGFGSFVTIIATPTGTNTQAFNSRTAEIRLVPTGVIQPPAETPTAAFQFSPELIGPNQTVTFDGTASCGGAVSTSGACASASAITTYRWNFGDGTSGSGAVATHSYAQAASYNVTLTVTNDRGLSASTTDTLTVSVSDLPTAAFTTSPSTKRVNTTVFFNGTSSRPGTGRTIVSYDWDFGDGTAHGSGAETTHAYTAANTYTVTLRVTDDLGQSTTTSGTVVITP